jgi:hypothetical protein
MKITGYRSTYMGDGIEVVEALETTLPVEVITEQNLNGMPWEKVDIQMLPHVPSKGTSGGRVLGTRRGRRRHRGNCSDQQAVAFSYTVGGQVQQVSRGAIIIDRARPAARFLCQAFELGDAAVGNTELFAKLSRMKQMMKPMALQRMTEEYLTNGEDLPACIQLRSTFERQTCSRYHRGESWYFSEGRPEWAIIAACECQVHGHTISRLGFYKEWREYCYAFDGLTHAVAYYDSPAAQRLLTKFSQHGQVVESLRVDVLPFAYLHPVCWLRVPARDEVGEHRSIAPVDVTLPEIPPYAYLYTSEAPIPVPHPEALPVIDQAAAVMAILARTQGNIFAVDAPPMPMADDWLRDEATYLLMAVPSGGRHAS